MLNFNQFNKKKEKYEVVKSRSGLPMFVLPLPDSLNNLTSDDEEEVSKSVIYKWYNNRYFSIKYLVFFEMLIWENSHKGFSKSI